MTTPLTAEQIRTKYGRVLREGVEHFRRDPLLVVEMIESHPACQANLQRLRRESAPARPTQRPLRKPSDEALRRAYEEGRSGADVAREIGVCDGTVFQWWEDLGLHASARPRAAVKYRGTGRPSTTVQEERERLVKEHFEQGLSRSDSAALLHISETGVAGIRKRLGIDESTRTVVRAQRWDAVASRERFAELRAQGLQQAAAAEVLGCHVDVVRRAWKALRLSA